MTGISREQAALLFKAIRKRHKYGAKRSQSRDGKWFASKAEMTRYEELLLLVKAKCISDLVLQPRYPLLVNGQKVGEYRGDFRYLDLSGSIAVEDVKGVETQVYKLKKRLLEALYPGMKIIEIR